MNQININQAKTQLSRLIERVAGGEEILSQNLENRLLD
jgi:antitoxin (DNA-binding transcriptional repressor) of toxin-antitoxin stability system